MKFHSMSLSEKFTLLYFTTVDREEEAYWHIALGSVWYIVVFYFISS